MRIGAVVPDNSQLMARLQRLGGTEIVFFPNPGKAGESLVAAATYQLLVDLGITLRSFASVTDFEGCTVLIGGGGNLVPQYRAVRKALLTCHRQAQSVIVLPHTIRGNEDLISSLGRNVEIYCRDVLSYEHVIEHRSEATAFLAHDMAFGLDVERFLSDGRSREAKGLIEQRVPKKALVELMSEAPVRFFFRSDRHGDSRIVPKSSLDLLALFKTGVLGDEAEAGAAALLSYLHKPIEVHTDMLHVAIASCLLRKRVYLYDDVDGKNGGVYRHSMHGVFPDVQLIP